MQRAEIWKEVRHAASSWNQPIPNLVDLCISGIYQASIQTITQPKPLTFVQQLKRKVFEFQKKIKSLTSAKDVAVEIPTGTIILWPVEFSHVKQLMPLVKSFKSRGVVYTWVTNKDKVVRMLRDLNENVVLVPAVTGKSRGELIQHTTTFINTTILSKKIAQSIVKVVFGNADLIDSLIETNQKILNGNNPRALIVGNDLTLEGRIAATLFRQKDVFTCSLQHGDMSGVLHEVHCVNEFYLFGEASKKQQLGGNETKFMVTGSPAFYSIRNNKSNNVPTSSSNPYILVTFSGPGDNTSHPHHEKLVRAVYHLEERVRDRQIIFKLHPKDRKENYLHVAKDFPANKIRIIEYESDASAKSTLDWIREAALVITGASTTAIEAMALDIPVISMDLANEYKQVGFIDANASIHITTPEALFNTVPKILQSREEFNETLSSGRAYAAAYFFEDGMNPADAIADLVITLTAK